MRQLAVSALCLAMLSACATGGPQPPPIGVSQMEIEPGRTRVTYRGSSSMSDSEVRDRALLAAAESALARGFDWFRVTERWSDVAAPQTPRFSFGLGTGSYGRRSAVGVGTSTSFGGQPTFIASLEIMAGRGARPPGPDAYDARSVAETLRSSLPLR